MYRVQGSGFRDTIPDDAESNGKGHGKRNPEAQTLNLEPLTP